MFESIAHAHLPYYSLTGIGEVVLLPLDVLKIKRQVNPEAFRGRGILRIIAEERGALYNGWGWTMARNAPGSFAVSLFPTPLFLYHPSPIPVILHYTFYFYPFSSSISYPVSDALSSSSAALRRLRFHKGLPPRHHRLFQSHLDTKFHRLRSWSSNIHHRRRSSRCRQDAHSER
jgi:hypothetical protein